MADSLDAFLESTSGAVEVDPGAPAPTQVGVFGEQAGALLGARTGPVAGSGSATQTE